MQERIEYGFMGTILVVDLSNGRVDHQPMTEEMARQYLGGHGVNVKLLYDHVPPGIDPLSEQNALIICTGPLVGTGVPAASRSAVMAKSPQSGLFGTSNTGHLAAMLLLKERPTDPSTFRSRMTVWRSRMRGICGAKTLCRPQRS